MTDEKGPHTYGHFACHTCPESEPSIKMADISAMDTKIVPWFVVFASLAAGVWPASGASAPRSPLLTTLFILLFRANTYVPGLLWEIFSPRTCSVQLNRLQSESSLRSARGEQCKSLHSGTVSSSGTRVWKAECPSILGFCFVPLTPTCTVGGSRRVQRRGSCKYMHGRSSHFLLISTIIRRPAWHKIVTWAEQKDDEIEKQSERRRRTRPSAEKTRRHSK